MTGLLEGTIATPPPPWVREVIYAERLGWTLDQIDETSEDWLLRADLWWDAVDKYRKRHANDAPESPPRR